ncbi:MAG: DASS family sodium-coupled anion symporter [Xanthomonadales bacterium]|nr:DASS family sodium-coupled anion symporter [Gammaproteobacteria bacterium]MBT8057454.1 DASS family sodium-coupled anion symporter [Gammaproteobacteria bacterium]NNL05706.1 DASS family sodium-coupled anion symporter [Xanthomonadales bacterium]
MSANPNSVSDKVSYRDSRRAAFRVLRPGQTHGLRRLLTFVLVAAAVWVAWRLLEGVFPPEQEAVLFLFLLAVGLWITEAVPAFAVGLLIMGYLVFALGTTLIHPEPWDVAPYLNTWSSPVIWLMLGGFFMAEGLSRTGLDRHLFRLAIKPAGTRPAMVLLAVMMTSGVASMFISNTSTTVLMIGAVLPLVRQLGRKEPFAKALMVAIPMAASVGGMGTIIGSPPNAIAAGVASGFGKEIDFVEWMMIGAPTAIIMILIGWVVLLKLFPANTGEVKLEMDSMEEPEMPGLRERLLVGGITAITVVMWLTTPIHGIHVAAISLIPIVGLTMTQVMGAAHVRGLPWDTLMLVAGGLSLGAAVTDTGLALRLASWLEFLTVMNLDVLVYATLALVTVILSNFMSNTATVSLILPVSVALMPGRELEMCLILGLSASCALLLPVSTPPNAVAFATGEIRTKDLRPGGILMGLLGPAVIIAWVMLLSRVVF